jgi:hypothetical protein
MLGPDSSSAIIPQVKQVPVPRLQTGPTNSVANVTTWDLSKTMSANLWMYCGPDFPEISVVGSPSWPTPSLKSPPTPSLPAW